MKGLLSQGVCKEHGNNYLTQQSREFVHGPGVSRAGWCNAPGSLHHYTNVFTGYQASYMPFQSLVAAQRYPIKSEPSFEQESSHHHHTIMAYIHTYARAGDNTTQDCTSPSDLCDAEFKVAPFPNRPSSPRSPFCISVRLSLWVRARDVSPFGQDVG